MTTTVEPTDLFVPPRHLPIWADAVGVSVKLVGMWGHGARTLYIGKGGILSFIDGSGTRRTQKNIADGTTLQGQFLAVLASHGGVASTCCSILIGE